jgi:hypothetical protein
LGTTGTDTARKRTSVAIGGALVIGAFAGGIGVGVAVDSSDTPSTSRSAPTPTKSVTTAADYLRNHPATSREPFNEYLEPFDYDPAPPLEVTPIDGYYMRIVKLEEVGGPRWGLPIHCRRCPAFRVDPGVETLLLYRGRFWLEHQMSGFRALGHYEVRGDRFTIFNDANCSSVRGEYEWSRTGTSLSFEVFEDVCPFEDERATDLMFSTWTAVRPCLSGIEYWWPAMIGCQAGESGVRP